MVKEMSAPVSTRKVVALSVTWSRGDTSRSLVTPIDGGLIHFPELLLLVHYRVTCTYVLSRRISGGNNATVSFVAMSYALPVVSDFYCGSLLGIVWSAFQFKLSM